MQRILLILCLVLTVPIFNSLYAQCNGGSVTTNNGATTDFACVNDNENDFVSFSNNSLAVTNYVYVITDDNNIILGITEDAFVNFEEAGIGNCRGWGLSFTGDLVAEIGDNAATINLANGCFDLSENFIAIIRRELEESNLMLVSGGQNDLVTIDDNNNASLTVTNENGLSENYVYLLQRTDGKILGINETGIFDLATEVAGTYFIFGYNFSGDLTVMPGNNITGNTISEGCEIKSANFITINKSTNSSLTGCLAEGATVLTKEGKTTAYACLNNGMDDFVGFDNTSISGVRYQYLITDENNIILGLPESGFSNFEGTGSGDCRVWGLSFQGRLTANVGDDITTTILSDDCFDLSDNFISIIRRQIEETEVSLIDGSVDGEINDNDEASFDFVNNGDNDANFAYVVTREDNRIIAVVDNSFDFAFEEPGKYFVYGYSFTGEIRFGVGMVATGFISEGCSEKSNNLVFIRKNTEAAPMPPSCTVDAGTLSTDQSTVTLSGGVVNIVATPNGDAVITGDFDQVFILTSGPELTIQMISPAPLFTVSESGDFRIHTLVAELNDPSSEDFFDGSSIIPGISTAEDVISAINNQDVCADLDAMGVDITVLESTACEAVPGLLFANPSEVPQQFLTFIFANELVPPMVPTGYEVTYFAALGPDRVIVQMADAPAFVVEEAGMYNIFSLVAETTDELSPDFFDLNFIVPGITTFETLAFLINLSGVCAGLDQLGTNVNVISATINASTHEANRLENNLSTSELEMMIYPNPTREQFTLRYQLPENKTTQDGRFQIMDITGKIVQTGILPFEKGLNEWQFSIEDLRAGTYFIKVEQHRLRLITNFLKIE